MVKTIFCIFAACLVMLSPTLAKAEEQAAPAPASAVVAEYLVGMGDVLDINILQPQPLLTTVIVAPDGSINYPYIGTVQVKGMSLEKIQNDIQSRLADGYMKYPVVSVSLRENRSKKFFVYGEVVRPGTFPLDDNMTILKAISMAGGFTKFGSASRVKVLRERKGSPGYETLKANMKAIMDGSATEDIIIQNGDIIMVSEGVF